MFATERERNFDGTGCGLTRKNREVVSHLLGDRLSHMGWPCIRLCVDDMHVHHLALSAILLFCCAIHPLDACYGLLAYHKVAGLYSCVVGATRPIDPRTPPSCLWQRKTGHVVRSVLPHSLPSAAAECFGLSVQTSV